MATHDLQYEASLMTKTQNIQHQKHKCRNIRARIPLLSLFFSGRNTKMAIKTSYADSLIFVVIHTKKTNHRNTKLLLQFLFHNIRGKLVMDLQKKILLSVQLTFINLLYLLIYSRERTYLPIFNADVSYLPSILRLISCYLCPTARLEVI